MKTKNIIVSLYILCFNVFNLNAQDIQFSQYYNVTPYINPAFVGSTPVLRAIINARWQWLGQDARYNSYYFSTDYNWHKYNSGIGLYFVSDNQAKNTISANELALQYVYFVNISKKITLRLGLQSSYNDRTVDVQRLTFPNQFTGRGFDQTITNPDQANATKGRYLDFASGAFLYSQRFWIGYAPYHLNRPNRSLLGETERLNMRHECIVGYKFPIKLHGNKPSAIGVYDDAMAVTPTIHYKFQGKSDQLDLGLFLSYYQLLFGLWYRGLPLIKDYEKDKTNNESFVFSLGVKLDQMTISYSYDLVISKQNRYNYGAHEININLYWPKRSKVKQNDKYKPIPCPK